MGAMRGAGIVIVSALLFLSLFLTASFLNLSWSMEYETFEPNAVNYTYNLLTQKGVYQTLLELEPKIEFACQTDYNYLFTGTEEISLDFLCSALDSGFDNFIKSGIESFVNKVYYDDYDCDFLTCLKQSKYPFVLISEKAKNYWHAKYKNMLLISIILFILLFFLVKKKYNSLIILGILMIGSSLFVRKINLLFSFIPELTLIDAMNLFFTRVYNVFLIFLILGIFFLAIGLLFKFFNVGLNILDWFKKKDKPLTKEDIRAVVIEEMNKPKEEKKTDSSKKNKKKK